ncbi:hypothetical protein ES703_112912 [subsurface metagenome]
MRQALPAQKLGEEGTVVSGWLQPEVIGFIKFLPCRGEDLVKVRKNAPVFQQVIMFSLARFQVRKEDRIKEHLPAELPYIPDFNWGEGGALNAESNCTPTPYSGYMRGRVIDPCLCQGLDHGCCQTQGAAHRIVQPGRGAQ